MEVLKGCLTDLLNGFERSFLYGCFKGGKKRTLGMFLNGCLFELKRIYGEYRYYGQYQSRKI